MIRLGTRGTFVAGVLLGALAGCLLFAFLLMWSYPPSDSPTQREGQQENPTSNQGPSGQSALAQQSSASNPNSQTPYLKSGRDTDKQEAAFLWRIAGHITGMGLLTAVLAGAAIIQCLIYTQMHQTAKIVERAYVGIERILWFSVAAGEPVKLTMAIKNFGKTPAVVTTLRTRPFVLQGLPSKRSELIGFGDDDVSDAANFRVMPGETVNWHFSSAGIKIPADAHAAITADPPTGNLKLWIVGAIYYVDKFGDSHETRFARCYQRRLTDGVWEFLMTGVPGYESGN